MFHFPGCPSHELLIHSWMTAHYHSRVPPFGYSRIKAYLQLPWTFRSLSRPSSAISALASTLRSCSLDLASSVTTAFLRLLRNGCNCFDLCSDLERLLLTGIFHIRSRSLSQKSVSFLCSFQGAPDCVRTHLLPPFYPVGSAIERPPAGVCGNSWVMRILANPQNDTE